MIDIQNVATHLLVTGGFLSFLVLIFLLTFLIPGVFHWFRLRRVLNGIKSFTPKTPPAEFKKLFAKDRRLLHLWSEYQDTLHIQREERDGQMHTLAVRQTVPAEAYFNDQHVVDGRLHTEFFKHLPGIFTGLGIIGTFTGLIDGLNQFQVSEDAATVRASLESLMHAVGEAFLISAAAITAAMVVTFLEKLLLASLYRKTESISHGIDANFDAGAGEEYLSRLVSASEASASQSKILKDALVKELGDILRELTASQLAASQQQVNSARENNQALGDAIKEGLKDPLEKIADAVRKASGEQGSAAVQLLNDVMVSFSQRLNDLFGGQITGINELNKQTAQAMQDAVASLNTLVGNLEGSGKRATDEMAAQMVAAIKAMEERQASINAQTQEFVNQIRLLVQNSQTETQQKLQLTLEAMGQQVAAILGKLNESQVKVFEDSRKREEEMSGRTSNIVSQMSGSVEAAIKEMSAASEAMAKSVSTLSVATSSSIDKMNTGAERIGTAASNFATAGDRVAVVMSQAATVSSKLTELSGSLTAGSGALQEALRDYQAQRQAVVSLLADVRSTVELAKKEASLTTEVLQRIETSTTKLGVAQKAADDYLDGVSQVLADSSEAFSESVVSTLSKVNYDFHTKLGTAVGLLSASVEELAVTLDGIAPRR